MRYLFQLLIILAVSFAGELLAAVIPLPIPACIYGMVLMLLALVTGLIPLRAVKDTGKFLVQIMPVMFVPAAVGLMESWPALQTMLVPIAIALIPVTLLVMAVSGLVTQWVLRRKKGGEPDAADPQ